LFKTTVGSFFSVIFSIFLSLQAYVELLQVLRQSKLSD
jgi:hypothetical protein